MLIKSTLPIMTALISLTFAIPYQPSNSTTLPTIASPLPYNTTISNSSSSSTTNPTSTTSTTSTPDFTPSPKPSPPPPCPTLYPSDITILNSRYPNYTITHLQQTTSYIQLRRETQGSGEIATRVQFDGLPSSAENKTCRLDFLLPDPDLQVIQGDNPSFDVYRVDWAHWASGSDGVARWLDYMGLQGQKQSSSMGTGQNASQTNTQLSTPSPTSITTSNTTPTTAPAPILGTVNGSPLALTQTRANGGIVQVGSTLCNCSLVFDVGMKYDSVLGTPNYWAFENVPPPAWPVQGFRVVVVGC